MLRGNLESKLASHGTKPVELRGGQVWLEKHTKKLSYFNKGGTMVSFHKNRATLKIFNRNLKYGNLGGKLT